MTIKPSQPQIRFFKPERIMNIVQSVTGIKPIRQLRILYPIWDVLAQGDQPDVSEYELLEQFLEAEIFHGKLTSAKQLHTFFGLEPLIVEKMLSFLQAIGHITGPDTALELTALGKQSLNDGVSYRNMETHHTLYFEGFGLEPLPRDHYDLRFLSWLESEALRDPHIYRLYQRGWDNHAVTAFSQRPDRADYNLPDDVVLKKIGGVNIVYLPLSIVETRQYNSIKNQEERYYIVISQISQMHDLFFERIVNNEMELQELLEEEFQHRDVQTERDLQTWLGEQSFNRIAKLVRQKDGPWQVQIAAEIFQRATSSPSIQDIGNYKLIKGSLFLQIWCLDSSIRRTSALEQTLLFIEHKRQKQQHISLHEIDTFLKKVSQHLEIEPLDRAAFRQYLLSCKKDDLIDNSEE